MYGKRSLSFERSSAVRQIQISIGILLEYNSSIVSILACNNCFNQVFDLYSSLRDRIDLYQYLSQSGCTLLSPPLQELLYSYSMNISLLRMDIVSVNQVDVLLYSALTELARQVKKLNVSYSELIKLYILHYLEIRE